ncbi:orexigenic neuropeptide QRFP [Microcaecilia unicolor]|uniref:Orexigenic neuropeptide QRFP n=1 Tax=Microcaecilia unicolor TaxID=1415580 RepID=A0A6P7YCD0_9AMPH|nr:orexigenic neuropeptide QRFP [Microcaecilia unicolor]
MNGTCGLSFLLLLGLGTCFAHDEGKEEGEPGHEGMFGTPFPWVSDTYQSNLFLGVPKQKKSEDVSSLFSIVKELQGFGKERAGFRFSRQDKDNEATEQKRGGSLLGSLAEEFNGYNRKKGGFSFRFGRG